MKKLCSLLLALCLCILPAFAEEAGVVYVSLTDGTGELALAYAPVPLTDADGDGALTLNDALIAAHVQHHPDGAAAFASEKTEYGLSLVLLWGFENGGSYGYCLNDVPAMSLADPIKAGDHVKAYAYTDLATWSDTYCYFGAPAVEKAVDEKVELTLSANGYDEAWAPVVLPVAGAVLTINGERTDTVPGEAGHAVLNFAEAGVYTVSAVSEGQELVAPVCIVPV